jgi:hypothetical protein
MEEEGREEGVEVVSDLALASLNDEMEALQDS